LSAWIRTEKIKVNINVYLKGESESSNHLIDVEDNWIPFIENEYVQDDIKWNFGFIFGKKW
jgi:hypothetical protein